MTYDAIIKDAVIINLSKKFIIGKIYEDKKNRFKDGSEIQTSSVISGPDENGIVQTRNSIYKIELAK